MNDIKKIIPTVDDDGDFNSWAHVALEKLTWSMLVNSLGYNNNFEYREWNDAFRKKYIPPPITPPKKMLHLQIILHLQILNNLQIFHHLLIEINLLKESLPPLQEIQLIHLPRHLTPLLIT